jgi:hypothetical protein
LTTLSLPSGFKLARYRFTLEALEPLHLPPFKGSALRGGFGHTFKRLVCFSSKGTYPQGAFPGPRSGAPGRGGSGQPKPCGARCQVGNACPYGYIFETSPPADSEVLRTIKEVARPFVIQPPLDRREVIPAGERLTFGLVLIGQGINYLPYFIAAFRELGRDGLGRPFDTAQGRHRGKYRLLAMDAISTPSPALPLPGGGSTPLSLRGRAKWPERARVGDESASPSPSEWVPSATLQGGSAQGWGGSAPLSLRGRGAGGEGVPIPIYRAADETIRAVNATISADLITARAATLPADGITLDFLTPIRLKHEGRWVDDGPPFHVLLRRLLDRVSSLSYFHCGQMFEADFRGLIERAAGVRIARAQTRWEDWARFSGRQKQRVEMGGLVGRITYAPASPGGDLSEYLPLLALGELVHVGKGTVFGNGRYEVGSGEWGVGSKE